MSGSKDTEAIAYHPLYFAMGAAFLSVTAVILFSIAALRSHFTRGIPIRYATIVAFGAAIIGMMVYQITGMDWLSFLVLPAIIGAALIRARPNGSNSSALADSTDLAEHR